jgi:membrane-bound lytic murein transglycosylase D
MEEGDFWDIRDKLPRETRNYVPLYIATTMVTMHPEQYGFPEDSLTKHAPYLYETFTVPEAVNMAALAKCVNISEDSLKAMNPELVRPCTPPGMAYRLKIPVGSKPDMQHNFAQLTPEEKMPWVTHSVQRRETLAGIARMYGVSVADLAEINGIKGYKSRLKRGARLRVPITGVPEQPETLLAANSGGASGTTSTDVQPAPKAAPVPVPKQTASHVVRNGENLTSIAARYGVEVADLKELNNIGPGQETILPGDTLVVSVTDRPVAAAKIEHISARKVVNHKVRRGETLSDIADKYNTSVESLRKLNRMGRKTTLKYGTNLKVETTVVTTRNVATASAKAPSKKSSAKKDYYKVQRGDTLSSIASEHCMSIAALRSLNPALKKSTVVKIGQQLRVQ